MSHNLSREERRNQQWFFISLIATSLTNTTTKLVTYWVASKTQENSADSQQNSLPAPLLWGACALSLGYTFYTRYRGGRYDEAAKVYIQRFLPAAIPLQSNEAAPLLAHTLESSVDLSDMVTRPAAQPLPAQPECRYHIIDRGIIGASSLNVGVMFFNTIGSILAVLARIPGYSNYFASQPSTLKQALAIGIPVPAALFGVFAGYQHLRYRILNIPRDLRKMWSWFSQSLDAKYPLRHIITRITAFSLISCNTITFFILNYFTLKFMLGKAFCEINTLIAASEHGLQPLADQNTTTTDLESVIHQCTLDVTRDLDLAGLVGSIMLIGITLAGANSIIKLVDSGKLANQLEQIAAEPRLKIAGILALCLGAQFLGFHQNASAAQAIPYATNYPSAVLFCNVLSLLTSALFDIKKMVPTTNTTVSSILHKLNQLQTDSQQPETEPSQASLTEQDISLSASLRHVTLSTQAAAVIGLLQPADTSARKSQFKWHGMSFSYCNSNEQYTMELRDLLHALRSQDYQVERAQAGQQSSLTSSSRISKLPAWRITLPTDECERLLKSTGPIRSTFDSDTPEPGFNLSTLFCCGRRTKPKALYFLNHKPCTRHDFIQALRPITSDEEQKVSTVPEETLLWHLIHDTSCRIHPSHLDTDDIGNAAGLKLEKAETLQKTTPTIQTKQPA